MNAGARRKALHKLRRTLKADVARVAKHVAVAPERFSSMRFECDWHAMRVTKRRMIEMERNMSDGK